MSENKEIGQQQSANSQKEPKYIGDLIHSNFYDELVIMGFPFDQHARNCNLRIGAYLGPDVFRRFLTNNYGVLKNVEYGINIQDYLPKISDYGNISTETVLNGQNNIAEPNMYELYQKLKTKTGLCLERNNRLFLVGGSKDMLHPVSDAYNEFVKKSSDETNNSHTCLVILTNNLGGKTQEMAYKHLYDSS